MTDSVGNVDRGNTLFHQHGYMRMSEIMNTDLLNTACFTAALHFVIHTILCDRKYSFSCFDLVQILHVVFEFIRKKLRHIHIAIAALCLRCCDHIFAADPLQRFADMERFIFKVNVFRCQSHELSDPETAPEENFKRHIDDWLIADGF